MQESNEDYMSNICILCLNYILRLVTLQGLIAPILDVLVEKLLRKNLPLEKFALGGGQIFTKIFYITYKPNYIGEN